MTLKLKDIVRIASPKPNIASVYLFNDREISQRDFDNGLIIDFEGRSISSIDFFLICILNQSLKVQRIIETKLVFPFLFPDELNLLESHHKVSDLIDFISLFNQNKLIR